MHVSHSMMVSGGTSHEQEGACARLPSLLVLRGTDSSRWKTIVTVIAIEPRVQDSRPSFPM